MLTNVIYSRALDLSDVGLVGLAHALAICATVFCDRGIGTWLTRELRSGRTSARSAFAVAVRSAAMPYIVIAFAVFGLVWSGLVRGLWMYGLMYSLPIAFAYWVFQLSLSFTQGLDRPHLRSLTLVSNAVLTVVITIMAVSLDSTPVAAVMATAVAYLIVGVSVLFALTGNSSVVGDKRSVSRREMLRESRKLLLTNISVFSMSSGDLLVAGIVLSPSNLGVYQLVKKVSQGLILPLLSVLPMLLGKASRLGPSKIGRVLFGGIAGALGYSIVAVFASAVLMDWLLVTLFGAGFDRWSAVALILLLAFSLQLVKDSMVVFFNASRRDLPPVFINGLVLLVFLCGAFLLSIDFGLYEFVWLLAASYGLGVSACFLYALNVGGWLRSYSLVLSILCVSEVAIILFLSSNEWSSGYA